MTLTACVVCLLRRHTDGGLNPKPLGMPNLASYALDVSKPASELKPSVVQLGQLIRDLYSLNPNSFRIFCPDETNSNRLGAVFETQKRAFMNTVLPDDEALGHDGRVMEVLSEHNCCGWLEGYNLTGRYGMLASYEGTETPRTMVDDTRSCISPISR
jgi:xylulose-5-phosphate/fructose-6-phosphate phosphoketolase